MALTAKVERSWEDFTPHLPEVIEDPYPAFRWLRAEAPVFYVESEDIWVLSRYADIVGAARNYMVFSQTESVGYARDRGVKQALTALDPPRHTELRRLTAPLFSVRALAAHRAAAVALLDDLLSDAFTTSGPVNFPEAVANPYLSRLVGGLMGIPEGDLPGVKDGATAVSLAMSGDSSGPTMAAVPTFRAYFADFIRQREAALAASQCPAGELTNRLFDPCPSGRMLTFEERVAYEILLATGGNETTAQLLSNLVLLLERDPDVLARLRRDPDLRPAAVEEVLRFISPVTGLFRHTTQRTVVSGTELPADAKVLLMYGSGNHDERHYSRPDDFVIDRFPRGFADADHLSFTTGVHVCLGAHLARLLIDVFLERMAERVEGITIAGPVVRSPNALVRVIEELPVVLTSRGP